MINVLSHIETDSDITLKEGQVKSLTTALAPFEVASQLLVGNLNADLLDGQHGSYYLAFANLTGKPTTLAGYGITDAMSLAAADARYSQLGHTHNSINVPTDTSWALETGITKGPTTFEVRRVLGNAGLPATLGNLLHIGGAGQGQIFAEWTAGNIAGKLHYRSKRDTTGNDWTPFRELAYADNHYTKSETDNTFVRKSVADTISAAHTFTSVNLTLPSLYYQTPNINNDVFQSYYPIGGNGTNPTRANLRVWDGATVISLVLRGDTRKLVWDGANIATENYVQGQLANYTPGGRSITINGVTQNLSADRTWNIDAGISQGTADGRYVSQSSANLISAAHTFTSVNLTLPSLYYQTPNINNDVFQSYYPIGGNGTNPTRANLRVWDGSSVMTLALRGDTGNLEWRGNIVATQSWVNVQGFVTGGPFLSTSGGIMTGNISFSPDGTGLILNGGAMVYKRAGGGLTFKRHSSETDPVVESNDGSSRWVIWHAGNITPVPASRTVTGINSIFGGGALSANQTLQLHGDVATPGSNKLYGTNSSGVRGWYDVPATGIPESTANARYVYKDGSSVMSGSIKISTNIASVTADYLVLYPTDYGAGKPRLAIASLTTANQWQIGLWDGSSASGRINIAAGELTHNGNYLATQNWVNGQGFTTGGPFLPTSGGSVTGNLSFSNDNQGIFFFGGGGVYKRAGTGTVLRRSSGDPDWQVESNDGTQRWTIYHQGNTHTHSQGDIVNLISDLASKVPTSRTITINGVTANLAGDRNWSVGNVFGSGVSGRFALWNSSNNITYGSLYQDSNGNVGVGGNPPGSEKLYVAGSFAATGDSAFRGGILHIWRDLVLGELNGTGGVHGRVGIHDGSAALSFESCAAFQINSTKKGLLLPRMGTAQWNAIAGKAAGLLAWNTDESGLMWWDGSRTAIIRFNGTNYQGWTGSGYTNF